MADWKFYGRRQQLAHLERMLDRKRWFFANVTGRRRIGKTTLIQQAMSDVNNFKQHVQRFLKATPKYKHWTKTLVGISPELDAEQRAFLTSHDILPQDLNDLTQGL